MLFALMFARILEQEERPVPAAFQKPVLGLKRYDQVRLLDNLFRYRGGFEATRIGTRSMLAHHAFYRDQTSTLQAIVSYVIDPDRFIRGYLKKTAAEFGGKGGLPGVRFGYRAADHRVFPATWGRSSDVVALMDRVQRTGTIEVGWGTLDKNPCFMVGLPPRRMDGVTTVAAVPQDVVLAPIPAQKRFLAGMLGLSLFWMIGCAVLLSRKVVFRLRELTRFVRGISAGNFERRVSTDESDEIGDLAVSLNEMAVGLDHQSRLKRYVSGLVRDEVRKDDAVSLALGGERREVVVMFCHLHGFAARKDGFDPLNTRDQVNVYLSAVGRAVHTQGGIVCKVVGDGILSVFLPDGSLAKAVAAGLGAARSAFAHAASQGVGVDVGIHAGSVLLGKVGSARGLLDLTVIGDTVNVAARICSEAGTRSGGAILVSGKVHALSDVTGSCLRLPEVSLKGKEQTMDLYELLPDTA